MSRTVRQNAAPETEPYNPGDPENCAACHHDVCRYHAGFTDGADYVRALIITAVTDPTAWDLLCGRYDEIQHEHGGVGDGFAAFVTACTRYAKAATQ